MTDIIIEGEFKVRGIATIERLAQPLKYLKLRVAYPPPPIQVEAMSSVGKSIKKGCGKEICKVPDVLICGESKDLKENIILCDECLKNKEKQEK